IERLDLLAEPPGSLRRDQAAVNGDDLVGFEQLLLQLAPAAIVFPGNELTCLGTEGDRRVHGEGDVFAGEERRCRPGRVERAVGNGVEILVGGNQSAWLVEPRVDRA